MNTPIERYCFRIGHYMDPEVLTEKYQPLEVCSDGKRIQENVTHVVAKAHSYFTAHPDIQSLEQLLRTGSQAFKCASPTPDYNKVYCDNVACVHDDDLVTGTYMQEPIMVATHQFDVCDKDARKTFAFATIRTVPNMTSFEGATLESWVTMIHVSPPDINYKQLTNTLSQHENNHPMIHALVVAECIQQESIKAFLGLENTLFACHDAATK